MCVCACELWLAGPHRVQCSSTTALSSAAFPFRWQRSRHATACHSTIVACCVLLSHVACCTLTMVCGTLHLYFRLQCIMPVAHVATLRRSFSSSGLGQQLHGCPIVLGVHALRPGSHAMPCCMVHPADCARSRMPSARQASVIAADLNADGQLELLAADSRHNVAVFDR